jgi:hypothetical protein
VSDLTERLRALANAEHDDLSTADEAADRIEELESTLNGMQIKLTRTLTLKCKRLLSGVLG